MEDLALAFIADGTLDEAKYEGVMGSDWWSIWYVVSAQNPAFVARVIGAWFDRRFAQAAERGNADPFSNGLRLASYSQSSEDVIKQCAEQAPRDFTRELFPRFVRLDRSVPQEVLVAASMLGSPDEQLRDALAEAMASLAKTLPKELDAIVDAEVPSESRWMSSLLLHAWSTNPETYAERIIRFILDYPAQRLNLGYDVSVGHVDSFLAVSRTAVAAASSNCTEESFAALEETILCCTPDWEQGT